MHYAVLHLIDHVELDYIDGEGDTNENVLSLVHSGKWPRAVRANGHLLLNSEKVCQVLMAIHTM